MEYEMPINDLYIYTKIDPKRKKRNIYFLFKAKRTYFVYDEQPNAIKLF